MIHILTLSFAHAAPIYYDHPPFSQVIYCQDLTQRGCLSKKCCFGRSFAMPNPLPCKLNELQLCKRLIVRANRKFTFTCKYSPRVISLSTQIQGVQKVKKLLKVANFPPILSHPTKNDVPLDLNSKYHQRSITKASFLHASQKTDGNESVRALVPQHRSLLNFIIEPSLNISLV